MVEENDAEVVVEEEKEVKVFKEKEAERLMKSSWR